MCFQTKEKAGKEDQQPIYKNYLNWLIKCLKTKICLISLEITFLITWRITRISRSKWVWSWKGWGWMWLRSGWKKSEETRSCLNFQIWSNSRTIRSSNNKKNLKKNLGRLPRLNWWNNLPKIYLNHCNSNRKLKVSYNPTINISQII